MNIIRLNLEQILHTDGKKHGQKQKKVSVFFCPCGVVLRNLLLRRKFVTRNTNFLNRPIFHPFFPRNSHGDTPTTRILCQWKSPEELVVFVYENYPVAEAPTVLRLALLMLLQNNLTLLPLLNRVDALKYRRQLPQTDRSDLPHLILAFKHNCNYIVTYDSHFSNIDQAPAITPEDLLLLINPKQ